MTDSAPVHVSHALGLDLCGHVLDGRYEITSKIGSGGMATVYEGRRVGLDRPIAVKILRPELAENDHNVRRFLREARAAAAIVHPNIVSIVDVGESSRPVYFVMERLQGTDLRAVLRRDRRLPWPRARDLVLQICAALSAAHARGIIHRDIKPANCMLVVDEDGRELVKVLDFGIAKVLEDAQDLTANVTATHGIVGTVAYMAPEQARGGTIDARTDIYAVGTLLYEMLAGQVPFPDKNPFVAIGRQLTERPEPLRTHRPELGSEVESVVMTCLEKDPDARFQSMDALMGALLACEGESTLEVLARVHAPSEPVSIRHPTDVIDPSAIASARDTDAPLARAEGRSEARPASAAAVRPAATDPYPGTAGTPQVAGRSDAATVARAPSRAEPDAARPRPRAASSASSTSQTHARAGWIGIAIGGIGMVAVGGTATWWTLFGARSRSTPEIETPAQVESAAVPAAVPSAPIIVTVPGPGVPTPVLVPGEPTTDTGAPSREPLESPRERPTPRARTHATDPPPPHEPTPTRVPELGKPDARPPGKAPDISPDLRNPFTGKR